MPIYMGMDTVAPEVRSRMMAAVRSKDTRPERLVRSLLHGMGYRFRLHRRDLPGSPDVVLPRLRTCVLVHGCFWHRHPGCRLASTPRTRPEFWAEKFDRNVARDIRDDAGLRALGWTPVVVWECETRDLEALRERLSVLLGPVGNNGQVPYAERPGHVCDGGVPFPAADPQGKATGVAGSPSIMGPVQAGRKDTPVAGFRARERRTG